jgi:toluene monooxygenase electron transfer component
MIEPALPGPLDQYDHYFAGPPPMVEAVQQLLMVQHRVPFGQVHFDRFV